MKMECYKLNEHIYHKIESFMENKKASVPDRFANWEDKKAVYSSGTLINNWYEDRVLQTRSITPQAQTMITEVQDKYRKPCKTVYPERKEVFDMIFKGYGLGQELMMDHHGKSYFNNYVTTNDLVYNHLSKGICGPFPRSYSTSAGEWVPSQDLCKIYGNLTNLGIMDDLKGLNKKPMAPLIETSEYRENYCVHDLEDIKKANANPPVKQCLEE